MEHSNQTELAGKLREVLKEHQRDGLSMIGNMDKLVGKLVVAVEHWLGEEDSKAKKTA